MKWNIRPSPLRPHTMICPLTEEKNAVKAFVEVNGHV
jgi:hypothetical protein